MTSTTTPLQKAAAVIAAQRARIDQLEQRQSAPIAVIGLGCRFPGGANTPEALWQMFRQAERPVRELPPERLADMTPGVERLSVTRGCYLDAIDRFDAEFFGISPREARLMDPQQRILMEVVQETLEHGRLSPAALRGSRCGVFMGVMATDYANLAHRPELMDTYTGTGTSSSLLAGRVAHHFDLRGPAVAINTACSSSLVAVHQAMAALRRGECDLALAGGVNVMLTPDVWMIEDKNGMLAADGRCKPFDENADGFGRGEGCGVVALKRLDQALADNDAIHGVLVGSAVNHDGHSSGLMVPNPHAQMAVIRAALADAGVEPACVGYVEAHGTGTRLGDPIEAEALAKALGQGRTTPLAIGSAKANLGHAEGAAGILGLLRLILTLKHRRTAPLPLEGGPTSRVDWAGLGLRPAGDDVLPGQGQLVGGVSSFGFSGTNAHIVAASPPEGARTADPLPPRAWADTRHWVPRAERPHAAPEVKAGSGAVHVTEWEKVELAAAPWPLGGAVIVHDGAEPARALADALRRRGVTVVEATAGDSPAAPGAGMVVLATGQPAEDRIALARDWANALLTAGTG
ncbi:MAG TPA: polyketide synthase, partial [Magnetospirillum sp.]|nr:polyketide synthase [Magnetospirillum sp.]